MGSRLAPEHLRPVSGPVAMACDAFDYDRAFGRNLGWLLPHEQAILRSRRVAIAGLGGVGGSHLLTLARLGIGAFNIADLDRFELVNFNRQIGATLSHLHQPKVEVIERMARDINPELRITRFAQGISAANLDEFLAGVDLYLDALDFFTVDIRRRVFAACAAKGIPAVTAAPLGMGVALLCFLPGGMTFEEYFRLEGQPEQEQLVRFAVGLAPAMLQMKYLMDPSRVNFAQHEGPSTNMACEMCAGVAGTSVLKILLGRGKVVAAPRGLHFDAYRNRLVKTWRPWGNRNPLQRLVLAFARRKLAKAAQGARGAPGMGQEAKEGEAPSEPSCLPLPQGEGRGEGGASSRSEIRDQNSAILHRILDLARWAPSGDNTQPWRFEVAGDRQVIIHGRDTRDHCVYDLQGHASQIALGALIETIAIAATGQGLSASFCRRVDRPEETPTFDVFFDPVEHGASGTSGTGPGARGQASAGPSFSASPVPPAPSPFPGVDPLLAFISQRVTQRRAMRTTPLTPAQRRGLQESVGPRFRLLLLDRPGQRRRMARLLFRSAHLRLTIPEAFETHRSVIQWHARYSEDRIPDQAVGADWLSLRLMQWAMKSWRRVSWMNRWAGGTLLPRLQLDVRPALRCAGHFVLLAQEPPGSVDDYVAAGRAVQRLWLTAMALGLQFQPEMTPLIFCAYARDKVPFTQAPGAREEAAALHEALRAFVGGDELERAVFMGRVGQGRPPHSRSLRLPLGKLMT